jgi:iron complex outermembrane receptor protein
MKQTIAQIFLILGFVSNLHGQMAMDTIRLSEVKLMESKLIAHTIGTQMDVIKNATFGEGSSSDLASLISRSSSVYIKQYGALATPSFRGTSSSHTLVLWNGVPLNSIANGLSDFSSIHTLNFTDVFLVHGGNASVFGSGAVGGSIHLNTNLKAIHKNAFSVSTTRGSYGLKSESLVFFLKYGKLSVKGSLQFLSHVNNFEFINTTQLGRPLVTNDYGKIKSKNQQLDVGYKLNTHTHYSFSYWASQQDREVPQNMTTPFSDAKQYDKAKRALFSLNHKVDHLSITLKQAYLQEDFLYTENLKNINSHCLAESYISDADVKLIKGNYLFNLGGAFTTNKLANNNYISMGKKERSLAAFSALQYRSDFLAFNTVLRKEWQTTFEVPVMPTLAFEAELSSAIKFRLKYNRNFRSPTFNDRFWVGAGANGNPDLTPEDAWNKELGFDVNTKQAHFSITGYTLNISDMIVWQQMENGNWIPNNIKQVWSRGMEAKAKFKIRELSIAGNYAFTRSTNELKTNKLDITLGDQLRYVPLEKGNISFTLTKENLQFSLNTSYTGEVITNHSSPNNKTLDGFTLTDIAIRYAFEKLPFTLKGKVKNLLDKNYTTYQNYPNPGRELLLTINYTIN